MDTLSGLADQLANGAATARSLVEGCLARAERAEGEGGRVFVELLADQARARAAEMDRLRERGEAPSPWAGIPISVKDLFDLAGQTTRAGSVCLRGAPPAAATAPAIGRLLAAGFVIVGRSNMTEFAYSGVGINPHYGTPLNPYDRDTGRIPGGSSSGAAVSVTDGMAAAGIGTDTGGSCRIPAALTGIVGYKPTARRIPLGGVYPLAVSLDSVGSLARSVHCCAVLDQIMAGGNGAPADPQDPGSLRLAALDHYATDGMDTVVTAAWEASLAALDSGGVRLERVHMAGIESLPELNARGGIAAAEAFALHRAQLQAHGEEYDPRVAGRIRAGAQVSAGELEHIRRVRAGMIDGFGHLLDGYDALVLPTVPIVAPPISAFATDEAYVRLNLLLLRNPSLINFLDGCAVSVPVHRAGEAPVGLMLAAPGGRDRQLLAVGRAVESILAGIRTG